VSDFGIAAELQSSIAMCGTFVGTFKYMSPERIQNQPYNYSSVRKKAMDYACRIFFFVHMVRWSSSVCVINNAWWWVL